MTEQRGRRVDGPPWTVVVTARAFARAGETPRLILEEAGCTIEWTLRETVFSAAEVPALLAGADGLVAAGDELSAEALAGVPRLRVIARWGVGYDRVDIAAATRHGIVVTNTPGPTAPAVADLTLAMMLALARRLLRADRLARAGQWEEVDGLALEGRTLGIVGFGRSGQEVARRARGFGMTLLAHDPLPDARAAAELGVTLLGLDEVLARADVVTLHAAASTGSGPLLGARELQLMKQGALLINTARGSLVDESALVEALESGHLGGAGLDVFAREPLPRDHPLTKLDNCVLSPHSAFATDRAIRGVSELCSRQIVAVLRGERAPHTLNPEVYAMHEPG
jgi:phosphoglycerate dehydrogenase-like enzyme